MNTSYNQIRPSTAGLIELHVFYVPEELWSPKLNTVSTKAVNKFISAGFIRVNPDLKLCVLRERLGEFLIEDTVADKFLFLKSVGRSLAVVKAQQEQELKLKSFAPPYALEPEIYLLPGVEHEGSIYVSSLTPERQHYNAEYTGFYTSPIRPGSLNPSRQESGRNTVLTPSRKKIPFGQDEEEEAFLWSREEKEVVRVLKVSQNPESNQTKEVQEALSPQRKNLAQHQTNDTQKTHNPFWKDPEQDQTKETQKTHDPQKNNPGQDQTKEAQEIQRPVGRKKEVPAVNRNTTERSTLNDAKTSRGRNSTGDSGIPESLEDRDLEYSSHNKDSQEQPGNGHLGTDLLRQQEKQLDKREQTLVVQSAPYLSPHAPPLPAISTSGIQVPTFQTEKEKLIEQLKQMKEERKQLEKCREELGKKVKDLLEENKLRKHQARDAWKKKYFDTKKISMSLGETVNKLRQELELHYQKLLTQLEARGAKKLSRAPALAGDSKNVLIIQIVKQQYEIDQQKRKLENVQMKLVKELKMRKQATSDLQVLRAELAQKKIQCSISESDSSLLENI
ncbi:spermatogenesis-associated protein 1 [Microcaecilia unicolor]|uniref:Spermatogenesis-associated protein 1 n=1 Tax=Microcaecilia unicolor TaxID=1415580 RepID=A0A6P7YFK7_9AMPH|nr:spermatogenesis-associated protein 1 [Microcaecilia unicolor]